MWQITTCSRCPSAKCGRAWSRAAVWWKMCIRDSAAAVQNAGKRERFPVLRAAFPSAKALHCAPHSLPAAWGRRLIRYGKESIQNRTSLRKSVEIGKRRVALLKTYHLIK